MDRGLPKVSLNKSSQLEPAHTKGFSSFSSEAQKFKIPGRRKPFLRFVFGIWFHLSPHYVFMAFLWA